jgi:hypothetical protein
MVGGDAIEEKPATNLESGLLNELPPLSTAKVRSNNIILPPVH